MEVTKPTISQFVHFYVDICTYIFYVIVAIPFIVARAEKMRDMFLCRSYIIVRLKILIENK